MENWPSLANLIQILILLVLFWYTKETRKIRKSSVAQIEALQKPCLTLVTDIRDYDDAILETDGAVGGMIVAKRNGNVAVQNIGAGPAITVYIDFAPVKPEPKKPLSKEYQEQYDREQAFFKRHGWTRFVHDADAGFNPPKDTTPIDPCGYVPNIAAGQTFVMQVAREILRNSEYTFLASYESLSGQRYETRSTLNNLVLTGFSFAPFKRATLRQILAAAIRGATEGAKGQPWLAPELTRFFRRRER
jgi:hypothetical protein